MRAMPFSTISRRWHAPGVFPCTTDLAKKIYKVDRVKLLQGTIHLHVRIIPFIEIHAPDCRLCSIPSIGRCLLATLAATLALLRFPTVYSLFLLLR